MDKRPHTKGKINRTGTTGLYHRRPLPHMKTAGALDAVIAVADMCIQCSLPRMRWTGWGLEENQSTASGTPKMRENRESAQRET